MERGERGRSVRRCRALVLATVLGAIGMAGSGAGAVPVPAGEPRGPRALPVELMETLDGVASAQRALAGEVAALRQQVEALQRTVGTAREDAAQTRDTLHAATEQDKAMREEVRGLYVEAAGIKGDIATSAEQVQTVGDSLGSFRLSTGIVAAVIILLQVVIIGLLFRGRA